MGECSDQRKLRDLTKRFGITVRRTSKGLLVCLGRDASGKPVHVTICDPDQKIHEARAWKNSLAALKRGMRQAVRFL